MRKYYHASPVKLRPGTVLNGVLRHQGPYAACVREGRHVGVYMTDSSIPHYTISFRAHTEGWYVYEIRPQGRVWYGREYGEWCADAAVVVSCIKRLSPKAEKPGKLFPGSGRVSLSSKLAHWPVDKRPSC